MLCCASRSRVAMVDLSRALVREFTACPKKSSVVSTCK